PDIVPYEFWFGGFLVSLVVGTGVQIHRYLRLSSPVERQQSKWVVVGLIALVAGLLGLTGLGTLAQNTPSAAFVQLLSIHVSAVMLALFPLSLAFSIFRYRLWDIDLLLNRALVYGLLTASIL